jgi:hypothetical protein
MWGLHRAALRRGVTPVLPAGVLAEARRGGPQHDVSRLLKGCIVEELTEAQARRIGVLAAGCGLSDTVDLAVVTSNRTHSEQGAEAAGRRLTIHGV